MVFILIDFLISKVIKFQDGYGCQIWLKNDR